MIAASVLDWLVERLPIVIFLLVFVAQIGRGIWRSRQAKLPAPAAKPDELEAQRRAREIQEAIRRKRTERGAAPAAVPVERREPLPLPPRPDPETTQMPEPFGRGLRRVLEELQREMTPAAPAPAPPPLPPVVVERPAAQFDRQQKLADEMHSLAKARAYAERRATKLAPATAEAVQTEPALRSVARDELLDDLRSAEALRRAFVLRKLLGPPVGLR